MDVVQGEGKIMFKTVVVPLDGSEEAARALSPAGAIAQHQGCRLRLVSYHSPHGDGFQLRRMVEQQAEEAGCNPDSIDIAPMDLPVADLLAGVLDESDGPLVVMSTRGQGRTAGIVGSVAAAILDQSHEPTMLIGPNCDVGAFVLGGSMIVATDIGDGTQPALELAGAAADSLGYEPILVNVVDPDTARELSRARSGPQGTDLPPDSAMVHRFADQLGATLGRSAVDYRVLHSRHPGKAIAEEAEALGASLIVMATHARRGLKRVRLGSVTAAAVTHARCPVLTVAPDEPDGTP